MATRQDTKKARTDVFQLLHQDHQQVTGIMEKLKKADGQKKEQLFSELQQELEIHMELEERFFYPQLEEIDELTDLIQDCLADHDDIKQIIQEMNGQDFDSEEWQSNCEALEDSKEDHVDREEEEVFPRALELVDASVLQQIGEQISSEKKTIAPQAARTRQKRAPRAQV